MFTYLLAIERLSFTAVCKKLKINVATGGKLYAAAKPQFNALIGQMGGFHI
jgi:hypothetical protein